MSTPPDPLTFDLADPMGLAHQPWSFDPTTPADQRHNGGITPGYSTPVRDDDPATAGAVRAWIAEEAKRLAEAFGRDLAEVADELARHVTRRR